ncbi:class I adenylate-forming enzyme family protein [Tistrella mobilis]|uniref:class I adenylate-forming enzyme family protein n=1 Tax=Tistrella mobilis TaxID=171437 RepID=UPI003557D9F5
MNIASWLHQTALCWPDRPAVFEGDRLHHDYDGLAGTVSDRARHLARVHGIVRGDRVAIFAKNAAAYLETLHACWWIGAVAVPINGKLHPAEAAWIVRDSGAKLAFTDTGDVLGACPGLTELALGAPVPAGGPRTAPVACDRNDLAWLFYTSGTTGRPKGVMLTHDNLRQMTLCYALDVDQPRAGDHMLYAAPMSHGAGLYMFAQIRAGGAHLVPASHGFDPAEIMALARSHGDLVFFAAPTMVKRLITAARAAGYDGSGIRTIIYGGGPMYAADIDEAVAAFGPRFVQIYGQGESPMTISVLPRALVADRSHPNWQARRASVGFAHGAVAVSIRDADGRELAPGETGEICVEGPTVMRGYWNRPEATAETLKDGWLHTGDLGHLDAEGFLHLTDRSKDVIISGGTNIYPREVEEALLLHPAVFEVAVIGEHDDDWGERVVAFVVTAGTDAADAATLDLWCRQQIAAFKRPKRYVFVDALPKNNYGKVLKTELRAMAADQPPAVPGLNRPTNR